MAQDSSCVTSFGSLHLSSPYSSEPTQPHAASRPHAGGERNRWAACCWDPRDRAHPTHPSPTAVQPLPCRSKTQRLSMGWHVVIHMACRITWQHLHCKTRATAHTDAESKDTVPSRKSRLGCSAGLILKVSGTSKAWLTWQLGGGLFWPLVLAA